MDNLTHSLLGYGLTRAGLGRGTPAAVLTVVLASNAPDIDIVSALRGGSTAYLAAHRGITHGLPGGVVLAALLAALVFAGVWGIRRRRGQPLAQPASVYLRLWGLALLGVLLHILMDVPTSYGTRMLAPFVSTWYALDWLPIIDIYVWIILIGGILWSHLQRAFARRTAVAMLLVLAAHYALRASLHQAALWDAAARRADRTAAACATSPTWVRHPAVIEAAIAGPEACIQAAAIPTFLSPFTWRAIRQYPGGYELSERSLLDPDDPPHVWIPSDVAPPIARARATPTGRVFLDFARFPAARIVQTSPDSLVVRIADVRFVGHPVRWDPRARPRGFFVMTVTLDAEGAVLGERIGE